MTRTLSKHPLIRIVTDIIGSHIYKNILRLTRKYFQTAKDKPTLNNSIRLTYQNCQMTDQKLDKGSLISDHVYVYKMQLIEEFPAASI